MKINECKYGVLSKSDCITCEYYDDCNSYLKYDKNTKVPSWILIGISAIMLAWIIFLVWCFTELFEMFIELKNYFN